MCPLCLATVGVMVSGAAVLMKKVRARSDEQPNGRLPHHTQPHDRQPNDTRQNDRQPNDGRESVGAAP
jgi:hypothetical protein